MIESAIAAGRPVYVAVVTNGAAVSNPISAPVCGAADGTPAGYASVALQRDAESVAAMGVLGGSALPWTQNIVTSHLFFLGYPDSGLQTITGGGTFVDPSGLGVTYADQGDATRASCNGDYHYLRTGTHAGLTAAALSGDIAALIAQVAPTDIYTHGMHEGHPDHATVGRLVLTAARASGLTIDMHTTLIHETGDALCQATSAVWWPNPESTPNPVDRSTPGLPFAPPAVFATNGGLPNDTGYLTCPDGGSPIAHDWGPLGAPTDEVTVPADMQIPDLTQNKKWLTIEQYASQLGCSSGSPSCGYLHGFVKSDEIFWSQPVSSSGMPVPLDWPRLSGAQLGNTVTLSVQSSFGTTSSSARRASGISGCAALRRPRGTPPASARRSAVPPTTTYVDPGRGCRLRGARHGDGPQLGRERAGGLLRDELDGGGAGEHRASVRDRHRRRGPDLIAQPGTWTGWPTPTYDYVWRSSADGATWSSPGVNAREYTVGATDRYLRVEVTATNAVGSAPACSPR